MGKIRQIETKANYVSPVLKQIGAIEDITQSTGGSGNVDVTFSASFRGGTFTFADNGDGNANLQYS